MGKFIGFLACLVAGSFMVIKTQKMLDMFGYVDWAEDKMRLYGGSRTFYKLFGLVVIIVGTMVVTGWAEEIIISIFSRLGTQGQ